MKETMASLNNGLSMKLQKINKKKDRLHIVYTVSNHSVSGGSKVLFEHCNHLTAKGHTVTFISCSEKPTWFPLDERVQYIQAPTWQGLFHSIPKHDVDLIVNGFWIEVRGSIEQNIAPVVYFEQGGDYLFLPDVKMRPRYPEIYYHIRTASFVYTVSNYAAECLRKQYHTPFVQVIPNAIDKTVFYPDENKNQKDDKIGIVAIGSNVQNSFKRINLILLAIEKLQEKGYDIEFTWICNEKTPETEQHQALIQPDQKTIGDVLRHSDIYVCASIYESFCLPALEAMTCGTAVVTSNNGGVSDFVTDKENALLFEKDNLDGLVNQLELLISDRELREKLVQNGLKTAETFSWDSTVDKLIEYYQEIASFEVVPD